MSYVTELEERIEEIQSNYSRLLEKYDAILSGDMYIVMKLLIENFIKRQRLTPISTIDRSVYIFNDGRISGKTTNFGKILLEKFGSGFLYINFLKNTKISILNKLRGRRYKAILVDHIPNLEIDCYKEILQHVDTTSDHILLFCTITT